MCNVNNKGSVHVHTGSFVLNTKQHNCSEQLAVMSELYTQSRMAKRTG